jgi:hypothetical protein
MRFMSFKILAACTLLPPVLYILTAFTLERQLQQRFARGVEEAYLGEPRLILDGSLRLKDALKANIENHIDSFPLIRFGIAVRVTVVTKTGKILYPRIFEQDNPADGPAEPMRVARDNYALLTEGLVVQVETKFEHNRILSNALLGLYVSLSLLLLFWHFRSAGRRINQEDSERHREIERLLSLEAENTRSLKNLLGERERLRLEFERLKTVRENEHARAEQNEEDLVEEITTLERKLDENVLHQSSQEQEIHSLREKIAAIEKDRLKEERYRLKTEADVRKRFNALYKNILINERALTGFVELNEDLKLKAEEIVHQLNAAPDLVSIKRKVFGRKNRETVLEVVFAYKGRLYFRRGADRRVEILAVGTKNTQARELEFISTL